MQQSLEKSSTDSEFYYDESKANRYIRFIEDLCTHTEGDLKGRPLELIPFWKDAICEVFGTLRTEDGMRRYLETFWFVPRKNSKTHTVAALALAAIGPASGEIGARGFIFSLTEDQARVMFEMCVNMIMQKKFDHAGNEIADEEDILRQEYEVGDSYIKCRKTSGILRVLSGNPEGKTGSNPSFIFVDEVHELKDFKMISALETGTVAKKQPLTIMITTAGKNTPGLPWLKLYRNAKDVRDGRSDRTDLHVMIWEAKPTDDPGSVETWKSCNPGWGYSVNERILRSLWEKMKDDPLRRAEFLQYHLNIAVEEASDYFSQNRWQLCGEKLLESETRAEMAIRYEKALEGQRCFGGLDLGSSRDMSAFALVFPSYTFVKEKDEDDKEQMLAHMTIRLLVWYWAPEAAVKKTLKKEYSYAPWVAAGLIEQTDGDVADYALIRKRIKSLKERFKIEAIGYDPWHATEMVQRLQDSDKLVVVPIRQGHLTLGAPTKRFRELVFSHEITHNCNAVLAWNFLCARVVEDVNKNIMLSKKHSHVGDNKIDGAAAIMNAMKLVIDAPPPAPPVRIYII